MNKTAASDCESRHYATRFSLRERELLLSFYIHIYIYTHVVVVGEEAKNVCEALFYHCAVRLCTHYYVAAIMLQLENKCFNEELSGLGEIPRRTVNR